MTAKVFVDTNVLVYTRDGSYPEKQSRASKWMSYLWISRSGVLSYQVLQEFYINVTAKLKPGVSQPDARAEIVTLLAWSPIPMNQTVLEGAWAAQDRYRISWWDALIVSAAQIGNCGILLSEDFQDGQEIGALKIVNPFRQDPPALLKETEAVIR